MRTSPTGSSARGVTAGRMRRAASSASWYCTVATIARSPAILAGGKPSCGGGGGNKCERQYSTVRCGRRYRSLLPRHQVKPLAVQSITVV